MNKLQDSIVLDIYNSYFKSKLSRKEICKTFNISTQVLSNILNKRAYRHLWKANNIESLRTVEEVQDPVFQVVNLASLGFSDYSIDTFGNVYSYKRKPLGEKLKPYNSRDYLIVGLRKNNKHYRLYIHSLVAEVFLGPRPNDTEVCHKNGNAKDNRLTNLKYDTSENNTRDRKPNYLKGSKHNQAKLTESDIYEIVRLSESGIKNKDIALRYNLNQNHVSRIINKVVWRHLW